MTNTKPEEKAPPAESTQRASFDPRPYLIKLPGRGNRPPTDYLEIKNRVLWLRMEHPDAVIRTELVSHTPEEAIVKATVSIPGGGEATDYGSETKADFRDYIEKASTKAVGRALALLGYGTQFADELSEDKEQADKRDYEVNQANAIKETADGRFDGRKRGPAEHAVTTEMPHGSPQEMRNWFTHRLLTISVVPATKADPVGLAKALAIMLNKAGLSENDRADCYDWFTGVLSGKDMSPEQLEVFRTSGAVSRPEDLRACAEAARTGRKDLRAWAEAARTGRKDG